MNKCISQKGGCKCCGILSLLKLNQFSFHTDSINISVAWFYKWVLAFYTYQCLLLTFLYQISVSQRLPHLRDHCKKKKKCVYIVWYVDLKLFTICFSSSSRTELRYSTNLQTTVLSSVLFQCPTIQVKLNATSISIHTVNCSLTASKAIVWWLIVQQET